MKKNLLPILLLIFISLNISAYAEVWSKEYSEEIADGVVYRYVLEYGSDGFSKLHLVECDLENPNIEIKVLTAEKGTSYLENTKSMAEKNNAIAAINGDFFNMSAKQTNMLGVVYQNGEMVSSPSKDLWATFGMTDGGKVVMDYFGFSGKIISPQGYETELYQINKVPTTGGSICMLTSKWGATAYIDNNMQAMLIKDGKVTAKVSEKGDYAFGSNDAMLLANYTVNGFFDNFNIGDEVRFEYYLTDCEDALCEATGGNTLLVSDGECAEFTNVSSGNAQRTAIGVDKSGKKLFFAVCEGRQTNCKGMTQKQVAQALIKRNIYRAVNFDGGGSSTMAIKNVMQDTYEVKNTVTSLRSVSTSVGVVAAKPYVGIPTSGKIMLSGENVLKGDYVEVYYKFFDVNGHAVASENAVIYSSDSAATVSDGKIYLNTVGKQKIYAKLDSVILETEVNVISDISSAYIYPERIELKDGESKEFSLTVWDFRGNMAYVHPESVEWICDGVEVLGKTVRGNAGYIGAKFPRCEIYCSVNGAKKPKNIFGMNDFMQNFTENGKCVKISSGSGKYTSIADMIRVVNHERELSQADILYMFGKPIVKDLKYWQADSYLKNKADSTLFVTLSQKSGSLNVGNQLNEITNISSEAEKNIVIIMRDSPTILAEYEKELFFDSLQKAASGGKNVFVVYMGSLKKTYCQGGITYISCGSADAESLSSGDGGCVTFYLSGEDIKYSIL